MEDELFQIGYFFLLLFNVVESLSIFTMPISRGAARVRFDMGYGDIET